MPTRQIPGTDLRYELIIYDGDGRERREDDGSFHSDAVCARAGDRSAAVTDVFFSSHGWKGDVPAALDQYDRWVKAMGMLANDRAAARERCPNFNPLIIGLHWPSLPFGDERVPVPNAAGLLDASEDGSAIDGAVEAYAARIAETPTARAAIRRILEAAGAAREATVTPALRAAYDTVFAESGLSAGNVADAPGKDQDGFDPQAIVQEALTSGESTATGPTALLDDGRARRVRDAILSPLQQASFWRMKDRARVFGEGGAHELLQRLLALASPEARFHLMGHSFGCIVVSATVAGPPWRSPLARPVSSLFLVQGALSLWSYAPDVPYQEGTAGYFNRLLRDRLVRGPIITTRSRFDTAVGTYYPRGAGLKQQFLLDPTEYPKYGGVGTFGARGLVADRVADLAIQDERFPYGFEPGRFYNVDAARVIKNGDPPSGAHSDIAHPEVGHLWWEAVQVCA